MLSRAWELSATCKSPTWSRALPRPLLRHQAPALSSTWKAAGALLAAMPGQALLGAGCQQRKHSLPEQSFLCFQQVAIQDHGARRPAGLPLEAACSRGASRVAAQSLTPWSHCGSSGRPQGKQTLPQHCSKSNSGFQLNTAGEAAGE